MFNVAVIRIKDILKYLLTLIIIICIIYGVKGYFFNANNIKIENINLGEKISNFINEYMLEATNVQMPIIENVNKLDKSLEGGLANENGIRQLFKKIIENEFPVINSVIKEDNKKNKVVVVANENEDIDKNEVEVLENENKKEIIETKQDEQIEEISKPNIKTEIVTQNPLADAFTYKYNEVKIKNETKFELTDEMLNTEGLEINKTNVIIYHTHTCESYTSSEKYSYSPTGNYRTTDKRFSVVRVGDELTSYLQNDGISVEHNSTYHDYPSYTGSYSRSLSTVSKILDNKKADIIIDLHRDAIGSYSTYAPTVKIGDDYCAQLMFVMGTNGGGLYHPNWNENLKWAVSLQQKANEIYPGLFKPIILRNSRYNQHVGKAACIIEVGATGNTLEQCLNSMKYLSDCLKR